MSFGLFPEKYNIKVSVYRYKKNDLQILMSTIQNLKKFKFNCNICEYIKKKFYYYT